MVTIVLPCYCQRVLRPIAALISFHTKITSYCSVDPAFTIHKILPTIPVMNAHVSVFQETIPFLNRGVATPLP